ncbi:hypothetical protein EWM64_g7906, partial [Hericium alpestre]
MADNTETGIAPVRVFNLPVTPPKRTTLQQTKLQFAGSTPLKPGLSSVPYSGKTLQANIKPLLRTDAMGNFQDSVDIEDFVQAVWGLKAADLKLNEWAYLPLPTALDELEAIFKEKRGETNMYRPVCDLFRDAYQQAKVHLKIEDKAAIEFLHMGSTQMMAAGQNFVQPDIMGVDTEAAARLQKSGKKGPVTTIGVHLCFEGKVGTGISLNAQPQGHASMPGPRAGKRAAASKFSAKGKSLRSKNNQTTARHSHDLPVHTPTSTDRNPPALDEHYDAPTGSKRKAVSDTALANKARKANKSPLEPIQDTLSAEGAEEVRNAIDPNAGPAVLKLTDNELQVGSYALELMSQVGNRRYTTAIFVRGRMISLWYFDRIGVLKTQEFNYTLMGKKPDPSKLLLVAVALSLCDRDHFGYEPLLRYPSSDTGAPTTVKGADLVLPAGKVEDRNGQKIANKISLKVRGEALHVQYGIVGRGTVVLPVMPSDKENLPSKFFTVPDLVVKLSWPVSTRAAEDSLIRTIRAKIPIKWRNHLPDLQCSATLDKDDLHLPRTSMSSKTGSPEPRVLRILVCARALPLYKLRSLVGFQRVFLDFVRCHRVVYQTAHVLHRDLSVNNVMFRVSTIGTVGVLNDWDLSEDMTKREPDDSSANATARHRTGTAPFMALELLKKDPPRHLYRHDLESFINILIWCAVHFDFDGIEPKRPVPVVEPWVDGDWQDIWRHKSLLFNSASNDERIALYAAVRPKFRPILDTWIKPLVDMLKDAYEAMEKHRLEVLASQAKNQDTAEAQTELEDEDDYDDLDVFVFEFEQGDGDNSAAGRHRPDPTSK